MIKAAIAGYGWWGKTIAGVLADSKLVSPALIIEPEEAAAQAARSAGLAVAGSLGEALGRPDIDAIIICTPHKFHAQQIIAAAQAGKHVFCEKPLCTTAQEARDAIAAVRAAGVQLGIGHERRFEPAVLDMRRRAAAGEFGTLLAMEGNFSQDKFLALDPANWRLSATEAPAGPLSGTGIHLADMAISFFGEPESVWANLANRGAGFANGDTLTISIKFRNGAAAQLTAILATPFMGRLCLFGSQGWMEIRDRNHPEYPAGWDVAITKRSVETAQSFWPPHPAVRDNLDAFARACQGEIAYPVSLEEMEWNVRTFEAIIRSTQTGAIERI